MHDPEEYNSHQRKVTSKYYTGSENFFQFPAVRQWRGLHSILGNGHNRTIIENGDNQDHERGEIELPNQSDQHESKL